MGLTLGAAAGSHTFQCFIGCDVSPDKLFLRGHYRHAYDGRDYISLNEDLSSWIVADKTAQITQRQWETKHLTENWKIFLEGRCVASLLRHLEFGKEILQRSEPPPWSTIRMTVGVVLLGIVVTGAVVAMVMMRKKSSASHTVSQAGLGITK
ncbi:class I histocompatibility antigen, B alpha chain-like [Onychomys torridus]|uniref:class I histocompatibility antigen, B alpha chain-like n=1 Tax=Onychomys torridus TaxID=38674 RepID=UPI00167FAA53|nr:class I histocompatibility antigen, B alpha chain-like [Onychomys torridus]